MSSSEHTVYVCSATGSQGGALARRLCELGWKVHTTTRNLGSPTAVALRELGVHLSQGDWDDTEALRASIAGCDKLFLSLLPNFADPTCERRQSQSILDIAKAEGVRQVVCSTTLAVSQLDGDVHFPPGSFMRNHMDNKKSIEQMVEKAGFEHFTALRPAFFMANFLEPKVNRYSEIRDQRSWTTSMTPQTKLPIVDHVDIAKLAVAAFQDPEAFHRRAIGVASDQMGVQEMLDLLAEAVGQPGSIRAIFITDEEIEVMANKRGFSNPYKSLRSASDFINMDELRTAVPLASFAEFLEREKEAVRQTYP